MCLWLHINDNRSPIEFLMTLPPIRLVISIPIVAIYQRLGEECFDFQDIFTWFRELQFAEASA